MSDEAESSRRLKTAERDEPKQSSRRPAELANHHEPIEPELMQAQFHELMPF